MGNSEATSPIHNVFLNAKQTTVGLLQKVTPTLLTTHETQQVFQKNRQKTKESDRVTENHRLPEQHQSAIVTQHTAQAESDNRQVSPNQPISKGGDDAFDETQATHVPENGICENRPASEAKPPPDPLSEQAIDELVLSRLGVSAGLFAALKVRHPATALHSLRVALLSSAWSVHRKLAPEERDQLEVAALLHDVGMIGLPDQILLKPGLLTPEEMLYVDRARLMSLEILQHVTDDGKLLRIVENVSAWFDGTRPGYAVFGRAIPEASRMIAVAEAFDAMTTDHLYRPAMSEERTIAELYQHAGRQFDPAIVEDFVRFLHRGMESVRADVTHHWLAGLDQSSVNRLCRRGPASSAIKPPEMDTVFQHRLLEFMRDGVIFVDEQRIIRQWNRGAERLSGIMAESVRSRSWSPRILGLHNERGQSIEEADCPILTAIKCGTQVLRRVTIQSRNGQRIAVDLHAVPVAVEDGAILGAVAIFHDASPETSLEERLECLRDRVTKDSLTNLANRAEFDRMLPLFTEQYQRRGLPFSLIICDLDRFKQVNDTFGHQAGDDAIRSLAAILRNSACSGDLVARYGGEEFVVICVGCDIATATHRAEEMRAALARTPQPRLNGKIVTASFGVTEVQPGDTPETILRRADRALLLAKARGRDLVVQLGSGNNGESIPKPAVHLWRWPKVKGEISWKQELRSPLSLSEAHEKLKGFIADHMGRIIKATGQRWEIEIDDHNPLRTRRQSDRPVCFGLAVEMQEKTSPINRQIHTRLCVEIWPKSGRERRQRELVVRMRDLATSFCSYLMVTNIEPPGKVNPLRRFLRRIVYSVRAGWRRFSHRS